MRDTVVLGSAPADEDCANLGSDGYYDQARMECAALIRQIRRINGSEPTGAALLIQSFTHDFGDYLQVVCRYDDRFPESKSYALLCEDTFPDAWDAEAVKEVKADVIHM